MDKLPLETVEGAHQEIRRLMVELDRKSKRGKETIRRLRRRVEILEKFLWGIHNQTLDAKLRSSIEYILQSGIKNIEGGGTD